jgi:two-component system sensor histidine kinase RpfC
VQVESRPFDLAGLLSSTVKVIVPQARYKGIDVQTELSAGRVAMVRGDSHHVRQVLLNLLSNAIKFTSAGGSCIRADAADTADARGQGACALEVEDTGIGHRARQASQDLRGVHAGRRLDHEDLRRDRASGRRSPGTSCN